MLYVVELIVFWLSATLFDLLNGLFSTLRIEF